MSTIGVGSTERGDWMTTISGRRFFPYDPRPEDVDIEDIAHHLAIVNRYNGATIVPYSVAEHCLRASYLVPEGMELEALLHDAPEYVLNDMTSPIKNGSGGELGRLYKELEHRVERVIRRRFKLPVPQPDHICREVKRADYIMLFTEKRDLCPHATYKWHGEGDFPPLPTQITPLAWSEAKRKYLLRFQELVPTWKL